MTVEGFSAMSRLRNGVQATLRDRVTVEGIGVHSGQPARLTLHPGDQDSGIIFLRSGRDVARDVEIKAEWTNVSATSLCTILGDLGGAYVSTVEHLMSSLRAFGVDNALIEIDGPEVPIMDGSAADFVAAIESVGLRVQSKPRRAIKVLKPLRVERGESFGELRPYDGARFDVEIDFDTPLIGRQRFIFDLTANGFRRELARARTFGFLKDVEPLLKAGFARGASPDNTVVLAEDRILNAGGLRWADEFVRHKTLDAIGDLALAGAPILGSYRSYRGGHGLNAAMIEALFADPDAWTMVEEPVRREHGHADLSVGFGAPAYGPDVS